MIIQLRIYILFLFALLLFSCDNVTYPKPYGYFRVDLPEHSYQKINSSDLPYSFEISNSAILVNQNKDINDKNWIDIKYPALNASIYCSYKKINGDFFDLSEDARKYVYKHSIKADGINERNYDNEIKNVHGILYDLIGNTASSVQFILTDSTTNFFRGSLYFNNVPNKDSIAPMANYIREDILRLIETFEWK